MQESREFYDTRTGPPSLHVDPQNVNGDVSAPVSHRVPEIETIDRNDNTRGNPDEPAPALPSSSHPLVDAHHDAPVDIQLTQTESTHDLPLMKTPAAMPSDYSVSPAEPVAPEASHANTYTHKAHPVQVLDPVGVEDFAHRMDDITRRQSIAYSKNGDPEKQPYQVPGTANPFDENARFDLAAFLKYQSETLQERNNELPRMGLGFEHLSVTGYGSGAKFNSSVASLFLTPFYLPSIIMGMLRPHVKHILTDVTGCVKPGEMLLVLGRPGSGCTTLLKSLASYRDGYRSIEGKVLYEGFDHKMIDNTLRGDVVYAPEDDNHFPTLSVKDTLNFAAATRTPNSDYRVTFDDKNTRKQFKKLMREAIATILGLRHTYNTMVGDSFIRGVSGGERKRVSIAEALETRARILMFDNSSRGLDSSTALEFVESLRIATDVLGLTTISSIYQAGESITQTFDKVVLMNKGHCVYFGPVSQAVDYFKSIGFVPQDRQTTSDFLVACTDPIGRDINPNFEYVPQTAEEMAEAFRTSPCGQANAQEVQQYMAEMENQRAQYGKEIVTQSRNQRSKRVSKKGMYMLSWPQQVALAIKRRAQIAWGDRSTAIVLSCALIFQSIIMGSVFFQMKNNSEALFSRSGVMFFALFFNSFAAMAEVPNNYRQRPIIIRHKRFAMLRPSADALSHTLLDIPARFVPLGLFNIIMYFMAGLSYDAGKFFIFFFLTMLVTFSMVSFFYSLTASFRSAAVATMIAGLVILDCGLYAGFAIPRPSMVVWWRWLSYCNPISFGFEVLLTNEFRGRILDCHPSQLVPPGASVNYQVCAVEGSRPGTDKIDPMRYLDQKYGYSWDNTHRNVGIIIGFYVFFVLVYMFMSELQTDPSSMGGIMIFKRGRVDRKMLDEFADDPESAMIKDEHMQEAKNGEEDKPKGTLEVSDEVFSWQNLCYDIQIKGNPRRLLDHVSGFVSPGKMTALMGESGAGKTTLLNVLAQRTDVGVVTGDFLVNGRPLPHSFQADTGYCQQQDVHLPQQTVREALQFSAILRQPRETPKEERLAYVEEVIRLLEMERFAEAIVGDDGEGLNVEQRKRLTIGVELAAKPSLLLFLDEPTSGLDAQAAWSVVRFLKKLASEGQAILCTIHQPSGELFNQFDRLLLLQKGGKTVYFGDLGPNSMTLVNYFEQRTSMKCGENDNPAEYILDVIGAGATATTDKDWHELFLQSELFTALRRDLDEIYRTRRQIADSSSSKHAREYAQPFPVQLYEVTKRAFISYWRNPLYLYTKMMLNVVSGLVVGSSFWKEGKRNSYIALQNRLFACFLALVASTSLSQHLQPEFIRFRGLFEVREKPSKMYTWPVMVLSALLVEIPWNIVGGTIYWIPWYYLIQFPFESKRSGYSWGLYMLFQLYYCTFAQAMAAISPNAMIASILFSTFFSFVVVFCGVVQPPPQLPYFWRSWMFQLSPFTWIMEGILGNAIGGAQVHCEADEMQVVRLPPGATCQSHMEPFSRPQSSDPRGNGYYVDNNDGTCSFCLYRYGDDYLETVMMDASNKYRDLGIIVAYIAFNTALLFTLFWLFRIFKFGKNRQGKKKIMPAPGPEANMPIPSSTMQVEAPAMAVNVPHVVGAGLTNFMSESPQHPDQHEDLSSRHDAATDISHGTYRQADMATSKTQLMGDESPQMDHGDFLSGEPVMTSHPLESPQRRPHRNLDSLYLDPPMSEAPYVEEDHNDGVETQDDTDQHVPRRYKPSGHRSQYRSAKSRRRRRGSRDHGETLRTPSGYSYYYDAASEPYDEPEQH